MELDAPFHDKCDQMLGSLSMLNEMLLFFYYMSTFKNQSKSNSQTSSFFMGTIGLTNASGVSHYSS